LAIVGVTFAFAADVGQTSNSVSLWAQQALLLAGPSVLIVAGAVAAMVMRSGRILDVALVSVWSGTTLTVALIVVPLLFTLVFGLGLAGDAAVYGPWILAAAFGLVTAVLLTTVRHETTTEMNRLRSDGGSQRVHEDHQIEAPTMSIATFDDDGSTDRRDGRSPRREGSLGRPAQLSWQIRGARGEERPRLEPSRRRSGSAVRPLSVGPRTRTLRSPPSSIWWRPVDDKE
jgi:hypothetical protein